MILTLTHSLFSMILTINASLYSIILTLTPSLSRLHVYRSTITKLSELSKALHLSSSKSAVLNLWSADHKWSVAIGLVVGKQGLTFILFQIIKYANRELC